MSIEPRLAYAQARVQARYAERPGMSAWTRLDHVQDFGRYLQQATAAGFGRWLDKLGPESTPHVIEISLREAYRQHVHEVAEWMPVAWRDSVSWFSILMDLEQIRRIMSGESLPSWTKDDPFLRHVSSSDDVWPIPMLADAGSEAEEFSERWRLLWRESWPSVGSGMERDLSKLSEILPISAFDDAPIEWLERNFRRRARQPIAMFSYLTLILADLLRLKGEMMMRDTFTAEKE